MNRLLPMIALSLPRLVLAQDAPAPEPAGDLSYSYAQLRYVDLDDGDGDGLQFGVSFQLSDDWMVLGEITSIDLAGNADGSTLEVGGGYIHDLERDFDLIATFSVIGAETDSPFGDDDDTGIGLSLGTRGMLTPELEIRGAVKHVNLDNNDTYLELGGDYYFTSRFSAGASIEFAGDTDLYTVGARLHFR